MSAGPSERSGSRTDGLAPVEAVRAIQRRRFIVRAGLVGWALPVGVLSTLGTQALAWAGLIPSPTMLDGLVGLFRARPLWGVVAVLAYVGAWALGGVVMGRYLWGRHERRLARRGWKK